MAAEPDRPVLLSVLFWGAVAATVAVHLTPWAEGTPGLPYLVPLLLLSVPLWYALPWRSDPGLVSPAFFALATLVTIADATGTSAPFVLIALFNVGLVFRVGTSVLAAVGLTVTLAAATASVRGPLSALQQGWQIGMLAALVVAIAAAVRQARAAKEQADRLAGELGAAHVELQHHADRAHDLAVAEGRARMARDLHDSVGHQLTVIKVGLENAERYRRRDDESAWADVRQAKELTGAALGEIRSWVRALRPSLLEGRRGSAALDTLARSFDGTGVQVEVSVDGVERPLDDAREVVLFRVLQESLTNALRHSGAERVRARLTFEPDAVALDVIDDGHGSAAPPGFGLTSLADRVGVVGGTFDTWSDSGGFAVRVRLPELA